MRQAGQFAPRLVVCNAHVRQIVCILAQMMVGSCALPASGEKMEMQTEHRKSGFSHVKSSCMGAAHVPFAFHI